MNSLAPATRRNLAPSPSAPATPDIGKLLRRLMAPEVTIAELERLGRHTIDGLRDEFAPRDGQSGARRCIEVGRQFADEAVAKARRALATLAPLGDLEERRATLATACRTATAAEVGVLLATTQDAFRVRADERAEIALSAASYVLADASGRMPSAFIVASAVDAALRSMRFAPSASELLALAATANMRLSSAARVLDDIAVIRAEATLIAAAKAGDVLPPPEPRQASPVLWRPIMPPAPKAEGW